jgi:acyl-ACP thioesterase
MQDVASSHAEQMGVGWEALQKLDLFWVLSWIKLEIISYPKFEDNITVKTWPKGKYKFYALRDLLFYTGNNIFCRMATAWLVVNAKSKKISDLKNLPIEIPLDIPEHALTDLPGKIKLENKEEETSNNIIALHKRHIVYSDLDINYHVNNAKYIEFILNCYNQSFHEKNKVKAFTMSFLSESKFDDELELSVCKIKGDCETHYIEAVNQNNNKQVFQALIEWKVNL